MDKVIPWSEKEILNLKAAITAVLRKIVKDELVHLYVAADMMASWCKAFTHKTIDPIFNYELFEINGDNALKWAFPHYLLSRYPNLKEKMVSELNVYYMSKVEQVNLFRKMGLIDFVKAKEKVTFEVTGDCFEAFFGALEYVSNQVAVEGLGIINVLRMISVLYDENIKIDVEKHAYGAAKTQVDQTFKRFGLGEPQTTKSSELIDGKYSYTVDVFLSPVQLNLVLEIRRFLGLPEMPELNEYLRQGQYLKIAQTDPRFRRSLKAAEVNAYEIALNTLRNAMGVTRTSVPLMKAVKDLETLRLTPEQNVKVQEKMRHDGIFYIVFNVPSKTSTESGSIIRLVAVDQDFEEVKILASKYVEDYNRPINSEAEATAFEERKNEIYRSLLSEYLQIPL